MLACASCRLSRTRTDILPGGSLMHFWTGILLDESGATAAEYALLIAFIAVVMIAAASLLGDNINNLLSAVGATI